MYICIPTRPNRTFDQEKVTTAMKIVYQSCAAGPRGVVFGSQALIFGPAVS